MKKDNDENQENLAFVSIFEKLSDMERTINKLAYHITNLEDALSHITRIPDLPLELEYDHKTNTLWAETRRKIEFNKNEAILVSLMFSKKSGKPKAKIFQCSEVAEKLSDRGEGINSSKQVFETMKRVKDKLDMFLNMNDSIILTSKTFHFSKLTLT